MTKKKAIEHIRECQKTGCFLCAVEVDGVHVGNVKLTADKVLSIIIFPPYQGKGYGPAAIRKMAEFAGGELTARIRGGNDESLKAFIKAGFVAAEKTKEFIYLKNRT